MRVTVTIQYRFAQTPDGKVWTSGSFPYLFWERYLGVFDGVQVLGRVRPVEKPEETWRRADGEGVTFLHVPYFQGPRQYIQQLASIYRMMRQHIPTQEAVILRLPSQLAWMYWLVWRKQKRPFGVEAVGDPLDIFAEGSSHHPLRRLFHAWFPFQTKQLCQKASAISYVTQQTLQERYPPHPKAFTTHYSSVVLPESAFVQQPTTPSTGLQKQLVTVAALEVTHKGIDILLDAIAIGKQRGFSVALHIVGDGAIRTTLEEHAKTLGLSKHVTFWGRLPAGQAVQEILDQADMFVLPSWTEGLPRAMIEAMARGLPCLGSRVGGIPELLPEEAMVPPGQPEQLWENIQQWLTSPEQCQQAGQRNLAFARTHYHETVLHQRRQEMYQTLQQQTQRWLEKSESRSKQPQ